MNFNHVSFISKSTDRARLDYLKTNLFGLNNGRSRWRSGIPDRSVTILPGIYSGDSTFWALIRDLVKDLNDIADVKIGPIGFASDSMMVSDFSALSCIAGKGSIPVGYYLTDNSILRKDLGINDDMIDMSLVQKIVEFVVKAFFGRRKYTNLKVNSRSNSGVVQHVATRDEKIRLFQKLLPDTLDGRFFDTVSRRDGELLLRKYGVSICYLQNFRLQPESPFKDRRVPDMEYALSGGAKGSLVLSNKDVNNPYGLGACRTRQIYGMQNQVNLILAILINACSNALYEDYAFTYHHIDPLQIIADLRPYIEKGYVLYGSDVSNFDASQPSWLYDMIFKELNNYIDHRYAEFIRYTLSAPVFQSDCGDGLGPHFIGDPIKMETIPSPGMPSGNYLVSHLNKCCKCIDTLYRLCKVDSTIDKSDFELILRGSHEKYCFKNAGDDELNIFPNRDVAKAFFNVEGIFKVKPEEGIKFLGVVYYDPINSRSMSEKLGGINDIVSFVTHTLVPERSYGSIFRKFAHIGLRAKMLLYSRHPKFQDVIDVLNHHFTKRYGNSFSNIVNKLVDDNPGINISYADALFVDRPERIHYMLSENDVNPNLIRSEYESIDIKTCSHFIERFIGDKL